MGCFAAGTLNGPEGLALAALVGLGFGFWLERAGFGSSRKLAAIFYLRDFAVLKVMFSAIVTAAVGLWALSLAGLVDATALYRPATYLWPQVVGGVLFGCGFVMGGWCPGTALVGAASGKLDAVVFLVAAGGGGLLYAGLRGPLGGFPEAGARGVSTLPEALGLPAGLVTLGVVLMAVGAFVAVTRVERWSAARLATTEPAGEVA